MTPPNPGGGADEEGREPVRQLRPPAVEMIAAVGEPDTTLGRFLVWPEGRRDEAVVVEAHGIFGALDMAADLFPDGDPWCADEAPAAARSLATPAGDP